MFSVKCVYKNTLTKCSHNKTQHVKKSIWQADKKHSCETFLIYKIKVNEYTIGCPNFLMCLPFKQYKVTTKHEKESIKNWL